MSKDTPCKFVRDGVVFRRSKATDAYFRGWIRLSTGVKALVLAKDGPLTTFVSSGANVLVNGRSALYVGSKWTPQEAVEDAFRQLRRLGLTFEPLRKGKA